MDRGAQLAIAHGVARVGQDLATKPLGSSSIFLFFLGGSIGKESVYKKDLHDPDNHNDVITHLEPDILECEVKWALESITMNKASGWNSSRAISNPER